MAPLHLLLTADEFNATVCANIATTTTPCLTGLYVAQTPIENLTPALQRNVPVPELVRSAGRGDVYGSSVWLGLEPTYTPLHRDPNPNLFVQLCGAKTVRLLPPAAGDALYRTVRTAAAAVGGDGGGGGGGNLRHDDMMLEPERSLLMDAVWGTGPGLENGEGGMLEVCVEPGDALFIPLGWWHSVRSWNMDGRINGSVNWWFR